MVKVEEQDALGLRQLSPKLISTHIITKYGKLHYSTLVRVVESCTMALIQQQAGSRKQLLNFIKTETAERVKIRASNTMDTTWSGNSNLLGQG